jgi:S1-C subfamily serine protease
MRLPVPQAQLPIFKKLVDQAVEIKAYRSRTKGWHGTGVIVTADGLILTAAHVVPPCRKIQVFRWTLNVRSGVMRRRGHPLAVKVAYVNRQADFALLQLVSPPSDLLGSKLVTYEKLPIGMPTYCVGFGQKRLTSGYIHGSQKSRRLTHYTVGLEATPGNSGGPACDYRGHIVGILIQGLAAGQQWPAAGWILPIREIMPILLRLKAKHAA